MDEYDISKISKDLKAVVKTDATGDEQLKGTVSFVAPTPNSTASSGGNTGTANTSPAYKVRIDLEDYDERLRVGMTAKTSIILDSRENVFAVAYDCVQTDEEGNNYIRIMQAGKRELPERFLWKREWKAIIMLRSSAMN